jgi:hypothetical protein
VLRSEKPGPAFRRSAASFGFLIAGANRMSECC